MSAHTTPCQVGTGATGGSKIDRHPVAEHVPKSGRFFVVIPAYNEERYITDTLLGLARQSDTDFEIIVVDNASTDRTVDLVVEFTRNNPQVRIHVETEPEKGIGSACDTGFRSAIARGAVFIARTDADSIPHEDWITILKRSLIDEQLEFVAGRVLPRSDDIALQRRDRLLLPLFRFLVENYGKLHRRGRRFNYPYFLVAGSNLAITSDLYLRSAGFPRVSVKEHGDDLALGESVRALTDRGALQQDAIVYTSIRRLRRYGYVRTLLWFWNRKYRPSEPDVRA